MVMSKRMKTDARAVPIQAKQQKLDPSATGAREGVSLPGRSPVGRSGSGATVAATTTSTAVQQTVAKDEEEDPEFPKWKVEDDVLLKNAMEAGFAMEALAKGAMKFSQRFSVQELMERWRALLYNPDVAMKAASRMVAAGGATSSAATLKRKGGSENADDAKSRRLDSVKMHYQMLKRKRLQAESLNAKSAAAATTTDLEADMAQSEGEGGISGLQHTQLDLGGDENDLSCVMMGDFLGGLERGEDGLLTSGSLPLGDLMEMGGDDGGTLSLYMSMPQNSKDAEMFSLLASSGVETVVAAMPSGMRVVGETGVMGLCPGVSGAFGAGEYGLGTMLGFHDAALGPVNGVLLSDENGSFYIGDGQSLLMPGMDGGDMGGHGAVGVHGGGLMPIAGISGMGGGYIKSEEEQVAEAEFVVAAMEGGVSGYGEGMVEGEEMVMGKDGIEGLDGWCASADGAMNKGNMELENGDSDILDNAMTDMNDDEDDDGVCNRMGTSSGVLVIVKSEDGSGLRLIEHMDERREVEMYLNVDGDMSNGDAFPLTDTAFVGSMKQELPCNGLGVREEICYSGSEAKQACGRVKEEGVDFKIESIPNDAAIDDGVRLPANAVTSAGVSQFDALKGTPKNSVGDDRRTTVMVATPPGDGERASRGTVAWGEGEDQEARPLAVPTGEPGRGRTTVALGSVEMSKRAVSAMDDQIMETELIRDPEANTFSEGRCRGGSSKLVENTRSARDGANAQPSEELASDGRGHATDAASLTPDAGADGDFEMNPGLLSIDPQSPIPLPPTSTAAIMMNNHLWHPMQGRMLKEVKIEEVPGESGEDMYISRGCKEEKGRLSQKTIHLGSQVKHGGNSYGPLKTVKREPVMEEVSGSISGSNCQKPTMMVNQSVPGSLAFADLSVAGADQCVSLLAAEFDEPVSGSVPMMSALGEVGNSAPFPSNVVINSQAFQSQAQAGNVSVSCGPLSSYETAEPKPVISTQNEGLASGVNSMMNINLAGMVGIVSDEPPMRGLCINSGLRTGMNDVDSGPIQSLGEVAMPGGPACGTNGTVVGGGKGKLVSSHSHTMTTAATGAPIDGNVSSRQLGASPVLTSMGSVGCGESSIGIVGGNSAAPLIKGADVDQPPVAISVPKGGGSGKSEAIKSARKLDAENDPIVAGTGCQADDEARREEGRAADGGFQVGQTQGRVGDGDGTGEGGEEDGKKEAEELACDGDVACFSDVEAMILDMDLTPAVGFEGMSARKESKRIYRRNKRTIVRLEQTAAEAMSRAMTKEHAIAALYGRSIRYLMKKPEISLGRATLDYSVDVDLGREGKANKVSRQQAYIKLKQDGSFCLRNVGRRVLLVNSQPIEIGQRTKLENNCLIEVGGMRLIFEINKRLTRKIEADAPAKEDKKKAARAS